MQADLRAVFSKANMETIVKRDSQERYLNLPVVFSMEEEIKKAAYTLYNFTSDNAIEGKDRIPRELLLGAKGIAFLTIGKLGFFLTGRLGTGLVISRLTDGSWSAPSAIVASGFGWGFQAGGELTDVMLILTTQSAVDAFSSKAQVSIGTELAVSLGPVGRSAGTDLHAGDLGASAAFSYAHSKGLFVGVSLEASVIACRSDLNRAFYGMDVKPAVLLSGAFQRPKAADPLYTALSEVITDMEPQPLANPSVAVGASGHNTSRTIGPGTVTAHADNGAQPSSSMTMPDTQPRLPSHSNPHAVVSAEPVRVSESAALPAASVRSTLAPLDQSTAQYTSFSALQGVEQSPTAGGAGGNPEHADDGALDTWAMDRLELLQRTMGVIPDNDEDENASELKDMPVGMSALDSSSEGLHAKDAYPHTHAQDSEEEHEQDETRYEEIRF
jgi:lipid-binding SYLF domain-containing protein